MTEENRKPNQKEICYEITKIVGRSIKKFALEFSFGEGLVAGVILPPLFYCALPTTIRYFRNMPEEISDETLIGGVLGIIPSGIITNFSLVWALNRDDWKYTAIPLTTNILSGAYELYRRAKKNLEDEF